jgi:hypothetical protein
MRRIVALTLDENAVRERSRPLTAVPSFMRVIGG